MDNPSIQEVHQRFLNSRDAIKQGLQIIVDLIGDTENFNELASLLEVTSNTSSQSVDDAKLAGATEFMLYLTSGNITKYPKMKDTRAELAKLELQSLTKKVKGEHSIEYTLEQILSEFRGDDNGD